VLPSAPHPGADRAWGGCTPTCRRHHAQAARPSLVGRLLEGDGRGRRRRADGARQRAACDARRASACSATPRRRWPERAIKVADRVAATLRRAHGRPAVARRLRRVALPARPRRQDAGPRSRRCCAVAQPAARWCWPGPDAEALLATACGQPLVVVHARDLASASCWRGGATRRARGTPRVVEGLATSSPATAAPGSCGASERRTDRRSAGSVAPPRSPSGTAPSSWSRPSSPTSPSAGGRGPA
jgi:hypothetical protein